MKTLTLLSVIGSTEPSTFNEVCNALCDDCPPRGDKAAWRSMLICIENAEKDGLIVVSRIQDKIDSMILTEAGAHKVRESKQ